MKKITLSVIITLLIFTACKKNSNTTCYECNTTQTGTDTIICDKSKAQLDALTPNTLNNCIKTN